MPCEVCSISTPFGFEGGYTDPTGLEYLIHRSYDATTGQFLSVDPDVAETGEPYSFVSGDPVNGIDPSGLCNDDQGVHVYNGPCTGAQLAGIEQAATQARAAGVATPCSNILSCAFQADATVTEHHWRGIATGIGIVAGAAALVTGVGAIADLTIIGVDGSTLGVASAATSVLAGGSDLPACIAGSDASCAGAAAAFVGGGLGAFGSWIGAANDALEESGIAISTLRALAPGLLGSQAFAGGAGSLSWDLLNALSGGSSDTSGEFNTSTSSNCA